MNVTPDIAPVVFIIFNRPDLTQRVFDEISQARPKKLFIIADGPREGRADDVDKCRATRAVVDQLSWDCEVFRNYSEENLGCRKRISSGLDWVFSLTERAIIVEDDCLPDQTFFQYCTELLEVYKDDQRIGSINGSNMTHGRVTVEDSYYFSRYPFIWGWATWRRVWDNYDVTISNWPSLRETDWLNTVAYPEEFAHWINAFNQIHDKGLNAWGYQFVFLMWLQRQVSIQPGTNLISNLGFRSDATHTAGTSDVADLPREPLTFPLKHPKPLVLNSEADKIYTKEHCFREVRKRGIKRQLQKIASWKYFSGK